MTARQPRPGVPVPPDSLLEEWRQEYMLDPDAGAWPGSSTKYGAVKGAAWGADEQLRLCMEWMRREGLVAIPDRMKRELRPNPPSLKQQALAAHERGSFTRLGDRNIILEALEALPDE